MATGPPTTPDATERREQLRRRLRAGRAIGDLTVRQLAERVRELGYTRGYSAENIGLMERGERVIQPQDIPVFAEACGVAPEFFTIDLSALVVTPEDSTLEGQVNEIRAQLVEDSARLAQLEEAVAALVATGRRPQPGRGSR